MNQCIQCDSFLSMDQNAEEQLKATTLSSLTNFRTHN